MTREDYQTFVSLNKQIEERAYKIGEQYAYKKLQDWYSYLKQNGRDVEIPSYNGRFYPTEFEFYENYFTFHIADKLSIIDNEFVTISLDEFVKFSETE